MPRFSPALAASLLLAYALVRYAYWRLFAKGDDFTADGYYTMLCVMEYKRNGHRRFTDVPNMVIRHAHMYPSLGLYAISFLPERLIHRYGGLMNSVLDFVFLGGLLAVTARLGANAWGATAAVTA